MSFAITYPEILRSCLDRGTTERNARTGQNIRALTGGASFTVPLRSNILPTCGVRKTRPHIAAAEAAWCILGHDHIDWLRRHTKVWDAFATVQDCVPCDGDGTQGQIGSQERCEYCDGSGKTYQLPQAYGYRWRHAFGCDQLLIGLERLKRDPSDRRVWISSWDPRSDILDDGQKTVPCPVGFTLSILEGRLNSSLEIRSSDLFMGLPYDVMRHAFVMSACAASLDVPLGVMRVTLAHPHLYETQWEHARSMSLIYPVVPALQLPKVSVASIEADPDFYVTYMRAAAGAEEWPAFDPKSDVVR